MANETASIQGLTFTIKGATERGAITSLDKLATSLGELKKVASGFSLGSVISSIQGLGRAIHTIDAGKVDSLKSLANGLDALTRVKTVTGALNTLAKNIEDLNKVAQAVSDDSVRKLSQMADVLHYYSGVKIEPIDSSIPKNLLRIMEAANVVDDETANKIVKLGTALKSLQGNIRISKDAGDNLLDLIGAVQMISDAELERLERLNNALSNFKNAKVPKIKPEQDDGGAKDTENKWKPVIAKIGRTIVTVIGGSFKAAASIGMSALKLSLRGLQKLAKGGLGVLKFTVKTAGLSAAINGIKTLKHSINAFKRIAVYRLLRTAIKEITEAFSEGAKNAYWYSRTVGSQTKYIAEAYDRLSSAGFKMKNQLGAAWATLISAIEPILIRLISIVTRAAEVVTRFFALLGGKSTYLKAIDYTKSWAEETNKGSKAAKEWRNQLMGFDEINRLDEPSSSGRGSSSDDPSDYWNMFEEVEAEGDNFFSQIRSFIENGEWSELGKMLGDKVNELFAPDTLNWNELGKQIGQKVQGVIDVAFNFMKTVDFKQIATDFSNGFNGIVEEINFEEFGRLITRKFTAVGDLIVGAIETINWSMVAGKISDFFIGAMSEAAEWIRGLDPVTIAGAIKDFIGGIKGEDLKDSFKNLLSSAIDLVFAVSNELFPDGLIPAFLNGLEDFVLKAVSALKSEDFQASAHVFNYKLYTALFGKRIADSFWLHRMQGDSEYAGQEVIRAMINGVDGEASTTESRLKSTTSHLGKSAVDGFVSETSNSVKTGTESLVGEFETIGENSGAGYEKGLKAWAEGSGDTYIVKGFNWIVQKVKDVLGIHSPSTVFEEIGSFTMEGFKNGLEGGFGEIEKFFTEKLPTIVSGIADKLAGEFENIKTTVSDKWSEMSDDASEKWDEITENLTGSWETLKENAGNIWEALRNSIFENLDTTERDSIDQTNKTVKSLTDSYGKLKKTLTDTVNALKISLTDLWGKIKTSTTDIAGKLKTSVTDTFNKMKDSLKDVTTKTKDTLKKGWEEIEGAVEGVAGDLVRGIDWILSGIVGTVQGIVNQIRNAFNFEFTLPTIHLPNIFGGFGGGGYGNNVPQRMATGGVVTRRSILEVGEDGREAIIPLDNNTQWISSVANQISANMGFSGSEGSDDQFVADIQNGVYDAMMAAMSASGGARGGRRDVVLQINGREFYRATFDDYKTVSREKGISLISA